MTALRFSRVTNIFARLAKGPQVLVLHRVSRYYVASCPRHHERWQLMTLNDRIEINPKIMLGKPVIRGTRITKEF